jgi:hypothetical protein
LQNISANKFGFLLNSVRNSLNNKPIEPTILPVGEEPYFSRLEYHQTVRLFSSLDHLVWVTNLGFNIEGKSLNTLVCEAN